MGDAPERIWAWCFNRVRHGGWGEWGGYARQNHFHPLDEREAETGAEYIRADIAHAELEAAVLAEREACAVIMDEKHAAFARKCGKNPKDYSTAWSFAADAIRARKP